MMWRRESRTVLSTASHERSRFSDDSVNAVKVFILRSGGIIVRSVDMAWIHLSMSEDCSCLWKKCP